MIKKVLLLGGIFALFIMLVPMAGEAIIIKDYDWRTKAAEGFNDDENASLMKMAKRNDKLFVSTYNATTGTEIWRTDDNFNWAQINTDGFGDSQNTYVSAMIIWKNRLWVATYNEDTGTELWKWQKGEWKKKNKDGFGSTHNVAVTALLGFRGKLYAFVKKDNGKDVVVFRAKYPKKSTWKRAGGFGLVEGEMALAEVVTTNKVNKEMYAGGDGSYVYKSANGKDWEVINSNTPDETGWGAVGNVQISSMAAKNGKMFVGTKNPTKGVQLWRYDNGVWQQRGGNGLGDPENSDITDMYVKKGKKSGKYYLYAGIENDNGLKVFRTKGGKKWYQLNSNDGFGNMSNTTPHDLQFYSKMLFVTVNNLIYATDFSTN
ncbi:hypothetical protein KKC88_02670 [Patescibacteria group bacterium]|nr:hypothetical protein [Patescibacteria group bacterium]MBU1672874.1 hypothetical protein [Patescibacteria group bacterium]MBU1963125.1 hypothetical protein [Patescibacteria group bacterium]